MGAAMFKVTKLIHFCYGHRLLNYEGKCRYLHGHNARVEIDLASDRLDPRGMVVDFNEMKQKIQGWIDSALDHKLLLNKADPIRPYLEQVKEPIVILEENPTAEVIARLIYNQIRQQGFPVTEVRLWETDSSFATYRAPESE